jgi:hypothetical protein
VGLTVRSPRNSPGSAEGSMAPGNFAASRATVPG